MSRLKNCKSEKKEIERSLDPEWEHNNPET